MANRLGRNKCRPCSFHLKVDVFKADDLHRTLFNEGKCFALKCNCDDCQKFKQESARVCMWKTRGLNSATNIFRLCVPMCLVANSSGAEMVSEDDEFEFEFEQIEEIRVYCVIYTKYLIQFH